MARPTDVKAMRFPHARKLMRPFLLSQAILVCCLGTVAGLGQESQAVIQDGRTARHLTEEWARVSPHLPDLKTASVDRLILAGDILRARRFPEDALDYYKQALRQGGDQGLILNRIGVTELELQHLVLAQINFKRVVKMQPKIADGWNNLGATEYLQRDYSKAIKDYKKAAHLDDGKASYRSNLGTAYFEVKNYKKARQQFEAALALDPEVFTRVGTSGVTAHILAPEDRARFFFEMARMSLGHGDDAGMLHWLEKASETGLDLRHAMSQDADFVKYVDDPRVTVFIHNGIAMGGKETVAVARIPRLPAEVPSAGAEASPVEK